MMILVMMLDIWVRAPVKPLRRDPIAMLTSSLFGKLSGEALVIEPKTGTPPVTDKAEEHKLDAPVNDQLVY